MTRSRPYRIYLAGPEVFLTDAASIGEEKTRICARYGFMGVLPSDGGEVAPPTPAGGVEIGLANQRLIAGCDALVANITPFRGPSADVGTAYEMGFAAALGRVVCAYTNTTSEYATRMHVVRTTNPSVLRDRQGMSVEDFGLSDNLMLIAGIQGSKGVLIAHQVNEEKRFTDLVGFEACILALRQWSD